MSKLEIAMSLEQIVERMRQLTDQEKRTLASMVLADPTLESFVEELDDNLMCEQALDEGPPTPFCPDAFAKA